MPMCMCAIVCECVFRNVCYSTRHFLYVWRYIKNGGTNIDATIKADNFSIYFVSSSLHRCKVKIFRASPCIQENNRYDWSCYSLIKRISYSTVRIQVVLIGQGVLTAFGIVAFTLQTFALKIFPITYAHSPLHTDIFSIVHETERTRTH